MNRQLPAPVPGLFLDRDGVIIENRANYVRKWTDVSIYPHALRALARLKKSCYKIIVVTNQSAVGRGLVSLAEVNDINQRLVTMVEQAGGRIDAIYVCPHAPEAACACRKPAPGLLLQASADHNIDLPDSLLVGDAVSDLIAGHAAGVGRLIFVRSGRGKTQEGLLRHSGLHSFESYDHLEEAVESMLADRGLEPDHPHD